MFNLAAAQRHDAFVPEQKSIIHNGKTMYLTCMQLYTTVTNAGNNARTTATINKELAQLSTHHLELSECAGVAPVPAVVLLVLVALVLVLVLVVGLLVPVVLLLLVAIVLLLVCGLGATNRSGSNDLGGGAGSGRSSARNGSNSGRSSACSSTCTGGSGGVGARSSHSELIMRINQ